VCAWCGSVKVRDRWLDALRALALVDASGTHEPKLTHGICPTCFDAVSAQAERDRRERRA
jgi:ribosomal protein L32